MLTRKWENRKRLWKLTAQGIKSYLELPHDIGVTKLISPHMENFAVEQLAYSSTSRICSPNELEEAIKLCQESVTVEPSEADNWYRLGCALLEANRVDEALDHLQKGETLNPKKEYICHKIAQAYLKKGDHDQALKAYERIPQHKRGPYILHGHGTMPYGQRERSWRLPGNFHQAIRREPRKVLPLLGIDSSPAVLSLHDWSAKLRCRHSGIPLGGAIDVEVELKILLTRRLRAEIFHFALPSPSK